MNSLAWLKLGILLAGVGQLVIVIGSLAIPVVLNWKVDVAKLRPLTRQVFWIYAGYIWTTNLCFGLISVIGPNLLVDGTPLSAAVTGFIALYWAGQCAPLPFFPGVATYPSWKFTAVTLLLVLFVCHVWVRTSA